jgi:RNA recognition motif-containing protein
MDTSSSQGSPLHADNDADLSFEALTFGEDSTTNIKKEIKSIKKKSFKKDRYGSSQTESEKDKSAASVYVSTKGDTDKIDVQALLKKLEHFGVVKASYFKEKQNFGFIQFLDSSVVDVVIDSINKNPAFLADGVLLTAERATGKGTHRTGGSPQSYGNSLGVNSSLGTSFGTNFGIPFSPSTPTGSMMPAFTITSPSQSTTPIAAAAVSSSTITSPIVEKPDTILVLKNLPFSLKQDQLQEILMAMNTTAPQSINLHFDNMGVFRGMAFIKYRAIDDAIKVYESLNGYDVGGRKVRVEYKRKNKGQQLDIPSEWQEEEDLRKLWEQVRDFSNNPTVNEISFTPNLTVNQRKQIHVMAEKLKLTHYSNGEGEGRYICIKKSPTTTASSAPTTTSTLVSGSSSQAHSSSASSGHTSQNGFAMPILTSTSATALDLRAIDIKGRRPRRDSENNGSLRQQLSASPSNSNASAAAAGNLNGGMHAVGSIEKEYHRPRGNSAYKKDMPSDMDWRLQSPRGGGIETANQSSSSSSALAQSPSPAGGITIVPSRQPKGPDGSKGFSDLYRSARKHTCVFLPFIDNSIPEITAVV